MKNVQLFTILVGETIGLLRIIDGNNGMLSYHHSTSYSEVDVDEVLGDVNNIIHWANKTCEDNGANLESF